MPSLQSLKDALLGTEETAEHRYECQACYAQFTSTEPTPKTAACPQCGGHRVRKPAVAVG